jgi:O-antigen/teichoic acid export membrane protein
MKNTGYKKIKESLLKKTPFLWSYLILMLIRGSTIILKFGLSLYIIRFIGLSELGAYGHVVALSLTAPVFFRAGLFTTIARHLVDAKPEQMTYDIKHYLIWVITCYGIILLLIPIFLQIHEFSSFKENAYIIWAILLGEHLANDVILLLNNLQKNQIANLFGLLQSAACAIPFILFSWVFPQIRTFDALLEFWAIGTIISLAGISKIFLKWPWRDSGIISLNWYLTRLRASSYLFFSDLIGTASQFIDRYIIAYFISIEQAGIYTLFFQLANSIFTLISSSVVNVHRPKIISAFASNRLLDAKIQLRKLQTEAVFLFLVLSVLVGGGFYFLLPWLNKPKVASYMPLMWITFIAIALKTWCFTSFIELYARHYDKELFGLNIFSFILISTISVAIIPFYGIYGIPLAIGLAYTLALIFTRQLAIQNKKPKPEWK